MNTILKDDNHWDDSEIREVFRELHPEYFEAENVDWDDSEIREIFRELHPDWFDGI